MLAYVDCPMIAQALGLGSWLSAVRPLVVLGLMLAGPSVIPATEVVVSLASGEVIHGELVADDLDRVLVRRRIPTSSGMIPVTITYDRHVITQIQEVIEAGPEYGARAASCPDTAEGHLSLASWCRDQELIDQARTHALRAAVLSPRDPSVTSLLLELGFTYADGSWQDENAYLARTGKVRYAGRIMSSLEAETLRLRATTDHRISALLEDIATDTERIGVLKRSLAATRERIRDLPMALASLDQEIADRRQAVRRFDQFTHSPSAVTMLGDGATGDDPRELLAIGRRQASDAQALLPTLLKRHAELRRQQELMRVGEAECVQELSSLQQELTSTLAMLETLRSSSRELAAPTTDSHAPPTDRGSGTASRVSW